MPEHGDLPVGEEALHILLDCFRGGEDFVVFVHLVATFGIAQDDDTEFVVEFAPLVAVAARRVESFFLLQFAFPLELLLEAKVRHLLVPCILVAFLLHLDLGAVPLQVVRVAVRHVVATIAVLFGFRDALDDDGEADGLERFPVEESSGVDRRGEAEGEDRDEEDGNREFLHFWYPFLNLLIV